MPIVVATEPVLTKWMEKSGIVAARVRPERYVAGVAATVSDLARPIQSKSLLAPVGA